MNSPLIQENATPKSSQKTIQNKQLRANHLIWQLPPNQITEWKRQLLEHATDVFGGDVGVGSAPVELSPLHAKIGQLAPENDFLERALTKAGLLSYT